MKRIFQFLALTLLALVASFSSYGQTTEEILARMNAEIDRIDTEGFYMVMEMKIPLLGTTPAKIYSNGKKSKMEIVSKDRNSIIWLDGNTSYEYDAVKNEITITNGANPESSDADKVEMFSNVTEGYTVKLRKETEDAWYFRCKKTKDNPEKDDPKTMDLTVSKKTYLPLSLQASASIVTITLRDLALGVPESQVTFNPADYPTATIIDKR